MRSDEEEEHISYAAVMDRSARGLIPPIVLGVSGLGHFRSNGCFSFTRFWWENSLSGEVKGQFGISSDLSSK